MENVSNFFNVAKYLHDFVHVFFHSVLPVKQYVKDNLGKTSWETVNSCNLGITSSHMVLNKLFSSWQCYVFCASIRRSCSYQKNGILIFQTDRYCYGTIFLFSIFSTYKSNLSSRILKNYKNPSPSILFRIFKAFEMKKIKALANWRINPS